MLPAQLLGQLGELTELLLLISLSETTSVRISEQIRNPQELPVRVRQPKLAVFKQPHARLRCRDLRLF